jgi:hypothetical protein
MFQIKVEKESLDEEEYISVTLTLEIHGITISLSPEDVEFIRDVDIEDEKGCFNSDPCNGEFSLDWNENKIDICCARYGDGNGGNLFVSIPATQETLSSLKSSLRKWKEAV